MPCRPDGRDRSLLVLGLGNGILTDDAVGLHAVRRARALIGENADAEGVVFRELCVGGFDLLFEVEGFDALVVVDAYHVPESVPGRVRTLRAGDLATSDRDQVSGHLLSLPDALELGRRLGYKMPELLGAVVIEVGPECYEFGETLTPAVGEAVEPASRAVCELVTDRA